MKLEDNVEKIKGVGPKLAEQLGSFGVRTVRDLLYYFPKKHMDLSAWSEVKAARRGEILTFRVVIQGIQARNSFRGRMGMCEAVVADNTGFIKVVWFNQPYLARSYKVGDEVVISGKVEYYQGLQITNPIIEKVTPELIHTGRLIPVYKFGEKISVRLFRTIVAHLLKEVPIEKDALPSVIREKASLLSLPETITQMHFPQSRELLERAKYRLAFEEVLVEQLAALLRREQLKKESSFVVPKDVGLIKGFLKSLAFTLTASQKNAIWEIMGDLSSGQVMNRLLEGDVGSGKTVVAAATMSLVASLDYQSVMLAPTEILAIQHYQSLQKLFAKFVPKLTLGLLTNSQSKINDEELSKTELKKRMESGEVHILVSTHAVFYQDLKLTRLGLLVIDEQHRFGVKQRSHLVKQGKGKPAHVLSMTATPIPRTLALALYGDLEISVLNELPKGRKPIRTFVVPEGKRAGAYGFIREEVAKGRQAYIITPLVEDSEVLEAKSVKQEYELLSKKVFAGLRVGILHGQMTGKEKEAALAEFAGHNLDILVATSVVEIGIDVPNASVMVIEDAERFGLAQLHQLRGRIGRGEAQSFCMLFSTSESDTASERLQLFSKTQSGFRLAEMDLAARGFGSLFGEEQSGFSFKYGKFLSVELIKRARVAATEFLQSHKIKDYPLLSKQVSGVLKDIIVE